MYNPVSPQPSASVLELCVAPCITARTEHLSDQAIAISELAFYNKFEILCNMLRLPSTIDECGTGQAQIIHIFWNMALVLSVTALVDIQRLATHTSIDSIAVPRLYQSPYLRPMELSISGTMEYATLVTWAI